MAYSFASPLTVDENLFTDGTHDVNYDDVPDEWFKRVDNLVWDGRKLSLPIGVPDRVYSPRHKGQRNHNSEPQLDIPSFPSMNVAKTTLRSNRGPAQSAPGTLVIPSNSTMGQTEWGNPNATHKFSTGYLYSFSWCINHNTQLPSLWMQYGQKRSVFDDVMTAHRVNILGSRHVRDVRYFSPQNLLNHPECLGVDIPSAHQEAASLCRLLAVTIELNESTLLSQRRDIVRVTHTGKDAGDTVDVLEEHAPSNWRRRWSSDNDMLESLANDQGKLEFDIAIEAMLTTPNVKLVLLRELNTYATTDLIEKFNLEYNHWVAMMNVVRRHGQFWFYRMQYNYDADMTDSEVEGLEEPLPQACSLDDWFPIPFWLVTKWRATVRGGYLTHMQPLEWESALPMFQWSYRCFDLSPAQAAFASRIPAEYPQRYRDCNTPGHRKSPPSVAAKAKLEAGEQSAQCIYCRQLGHSRDNCNQLLGLDDDGGCRYCHLQGHAIINCPERPDRPSKYVTEKK